MPLAQTKHLLSSLHIPGTCIQVSNERVVLGYNGMDLEGLLNQYTDENLYFLANIPQRLKIEPPHARSIHDIDIPQKRYVVFDIDLRKLWSDLPTEDQDRCLQEAITSIQKQLLADELFSSYRALVSSGNGLHIYYTSARPIPLTVAQYAYGYKQYANAIAEKIGYEVDVACSNIARIIRLPLSYNNKGERRRVEFVAYQDQHSELLSLIMMQKTALEEQVVTMEELKTQIEREPILSLCHYFGIQVSSDGFVMEPSGKKSSIRLNLRNNLVKRFSDKPGSGTFIHLYAALHNMRFYEAAKEISDKYIRKKLVMGEAHEKAAQREQVMVYRKTTKAKTYKPLIWNTPWMNTHFPVPHNTSYIVLAGETKSGKSTVAFDMACKNAEAGRRGLYITLEMTADQLRENIARRVAEITPQDERQFLEHGSYPAGKDQIFQQKKQSLESLENLTIIGKTYGQKMTIDTILDIVLEDKDIDFVVIDNLDKVDRRPGDQDDFEKQKSVSHALLEFTSTYYIPVILVHHLKKGQDTSGGGVFRSTNALSGTGKISHDADMVLFVARVKDQETGAFKNNQTFIRVMETRTFEPCTHRVYFLNGTFEDDDPSARIFDNAYVS